MTNRTVIFLILIVVSGIATTWVLDVTQSEDEVAQDARNDPDLYMVNATITQFDESGQRQHIIDAERLTHFPLTDVTTLAVPNLFLFSEAGEQPWDIIARNGRLLPRAQIREETLELWDEVVAVREQGDGDFINIQTESLTVFPDRDYAETDRHVAIDSASGRTTAGGGMKAWFEDRRFQFFSGSGQRVNTVMVPHKRATAG